MNNPRLEILKWPETLEHLLPALQRQEPSSVTRTPMDDGFVQQNPGPSCPVFAGTVELTRREKAALDDFYSASIGHHISFTVPDTGKTAYAAFEGRPFARRQRLVTGIPKTDADHETFEVEITLKDTTREVESVIAHGASAYRKR